jgi:hypothetical protein
MSMNSQANQTFYIFRASEATIMLTFQGVGVGVGIEIHMNSNECIHMNVS